MGNDIGSILYDKRLDKKLTLTKIHEDTFISRKYLEAMENNDVSRFPAEVYYIGTLRRYCEYLGINTEELLSIYYNKNMINDDVRITVKKPEAKSVKYKSYSLLLVVLLLALVIGNWYEDILIFARKNNSYDNSALSTKIREVYKNLNVQIVAINESWVKIQIDGKTVFEDILEKNMSQKWTAEEKIRIVIGYAPGIKLFFNNREVDVERNAKDDISEIIFTKDDLS